MRDYEELVSVLRDLSEDTGDECAEAADAIEELCDGVKLYKEAYINEHDERIEEIKRHKWISVEERLPKNGWWCLVWGTDWNIPIMAFCDGKKWTDAQFEHPKVTYWMFLPEPPKEERE